MLRLDAFFLAFFLATAFSATASGGGGAYTGGGASGLSGLLNAHITNLVADYVRILTFVSP